MRFAGLPVLRDGLWLRGAGRLRVHSEWFSMIRVSGDLLYFVQKHPIGSNTGTLAFMVSELSDQAWVQRSVKGCGGAGARVEHRPGIHNHMQCLQVRCILIRISSVRMVTEPLTTVF